LPHIRATDATGPSLPSPPAAISSPTQKKQEWQSDDEWAGLKFADDPSPTDESDDEAGAEEDGGGAEVEAGSGSFDDCVRAAATASSLQFRLLDYHGGISDLSDRLLRAPVPLERTLADVRSTVLKTDADLARAVNLEVVALEATRERDGTPGGGGYDRAAAAEWERQAIWWAKTLREDPLRIVRLLRFSATLGFRVHDAFWSAVPFAVESLRAKVSGSRKVTELRKLAHAGRGPLLDFMELAFTPLARFGEDVAFGDALFGGQDDAPRISITMGFDSAQMRAAAATLPSDISADGLVGAALVAATYSCDLRRCDNDEVCSDEEACPALWPDGEEALAPRIDADRKDSDNADTDAADAAAISLSEVTRACDGLCAPGPLRQAAAEPLNLISAILARRRESPPPSGAHRLLAAAAARWEHGVPTYAPVDFADAADAADFASLIFIWDALKLDPTLAHRRLEVGADFVVGLMRTRCSADAATVLEKQLRLLRRPGPEVPGGAVASLGGVPPHLRSFMISAVHVLARLRGEAPTFSTSEELREYLEGECRGLLSQLEAEWWEGGGDGDGEMPPTLRAEYAKPKKRKRVG
jgi:hypothetical protein